MKNKTLIIVAILFVTFLASFVIPVKTVEMWTNDDEIHDIGHYEIHYKNVYGVTVRVTDK